MSLTTGSLSQTDQQVGVLDGGGGVQSYWMFNNLHCLPSTLDRKQLRRAKQATAARSQWGTGSQSWPCSCAHVNIRCEYYALDLHNGVVDPIPQAIDIILTFNRAAQTESIVQSRVTSRTRGKGVDAFVSSANTRWTLGINSNHVWGIIL